MNSTHKGSKTDLQTNLNVTSGFERKGTLKVVESVSHETLNENNKIADGLSNQVCQKSPNQRTARSGSAQPNQTPAKTNDKGNDTQYIQNSVLEEKGKSRRDWLLDSNTGNRDLENVFLNGELVSADSAAAKDNRKKFVESPTAPMRIASHSMDYMRRSSREGVLIQDGTQGPERKSLE